MTYLCRCPVPVGRDRAVAPWLTFLFPPLANYLYPYNLAPGILGVSNLPTLQYPRPSFVYSRR